MGGKEEGAGEEKTRVPTRPLRECLVGGWGDDSEGEEGEEDGIDPPNPPRRRGQPRPLLFPPTSLDSGGDSGGALTVLVPVGAEAEQRGGGESWVHATVRVYLPPPPPAAVAIPAGGGDSTEEEEEGVGAKGNGKDRGGKGKSGGGKNNNNKNKPQQPPPPPAPSSSSHFSYSLERDGPLCADVLIRPWGVGGAASPLPLAAAAAAAAAGGGGSGDGVGQGQGRRQQRRRLSSSSSSSSSSWWGADEEGEEQQLPNAIRLLGGESESEGEGEVDLAGLEAARPDFGYWRRLLLLSAGGVGVDGVGGVASTVGGGGGMVRRRLLDTFGQSLVHVNRLYHQVRWGKRGVCVMVP